MKNEVIYIEEQNKEEEESIELTQYFHPEKGWEKAIFKPKHFDKIVYLGKCRADGDLFSAYDGDSIYVYKGHLNSGKY